jgi:hypothetical protein
MVTSKGENYTGRPFPSFNLGVEIFGRHVLFFFFYKFKKKKKKKRIGKKLKGEVPTKFKIENHLSKID